MTFLDAANSIWDWSSFDWVNKVDSIWKTTICPKKIDGYLEKYIKMVLSWVVMSRIVIAHLYTITYIANFYSIITWSRAEMLLPWLTISAFKNFVLEFIVSIVITLLYIQGNLSGFLFITAIFDKIITIAVAAHNWNIINTLYVKLNQRDEKNAKIKKKTATLSALLDNMIGMNMSHSNLITHRRRKILSLPNLNHQRTHFSLDSIDNQKRNESESLTITSSIDSQQLESICQSITDSLILPTDNKEIKIRDLTYNDLNESKSEYDSYHMASNSISQVIPTAVNKSDEANSKTSNCVCMPDMSEINISTSPTESFNGYSSRIKEYSDADGIESYSEWSRQWMLGNMLKTHKSIEMKEKETEYDFRASYDEKCCQWSSDEELKNKKHDGINKQEENNCQWSSENKIEDCENETSMILRLECVTILNRIIDVVFLLLESKLEIERKVRNHTAAKVLKSRQTETNQINVYKTSVTQTSSHDSSSKQYNLHNMQILVESFTKTNMFESTLEREKKELEALRVYNALTLWKYKEEKDKIMFNTMKASTSDKCEIDTLQRITSNLRDRNLNGKFDDFQMRCIPDKSRTNINISGSLFEIRSREELKLSNSEIDHLKADNNSCSNRNLYISTSQKIMHPNNLTDLKKKICNVDWTIYPCYSNSFNNIVQQKSMNIIVEESTAEIIDDYDTVSILQSAFSFGTNENVRGFYLGPGSLEFYSISEQIPNVFHEIIKTARIKVINYDFSNYPSTQEEDFGYAYFQNWTTTEICENRFPNKNTKETTNILHCQNLEVIENPSDKKIYGKKNYSHTENQKNFFHFDDESDLSDLSFSTDDYFQTYIGQSNSLSNLSNQSNMSEFEPDVF